MKRFLFALASLLFLGLWADAQCSGGCCPGGVCRPTIVVGSYIPSTPMVVSRPSCGCVFGGSCVCPPGGCFCGSRQVMGVPTVTYPSALPVQYPSTFNPGLYRLRDVNSPPVVTGSSILGGCPGGRCR